MPATPFTAVRHGFHFANSFTNTVLTLPGGVPINTYGLCGGMSFTSLDYFNAVVPVPTHTGADFPGGSVPPAGSRLQQLIYQRQLSTFNPLTNPSIVKFGTQALPIGRSAYDISVSDEWKAITAELAAGTPVPVGLIGSAVNPAQSHQVVGIDYDDSTQTLVIYDCNYPDTVVTLTPDPATSTITSSTGDTWLGYFLEDYVQQAPTYSDVVLSTGIDTNPAGSVTLGGSVEAGFTVQNAGDYPAHLASLDASLRGPAGEDLDSVFAPDGAAVDLPAGSTQTYSGTTDSFGTDPGTYEVIAYFQTPPGEWFGVPAGFSGTRTTTTITAS